VGQGARGENAADDVVAIADQLLVELYRALVDPAQVLLGLDATDELEQRLVARVDVVATRLTTGRAAERTSMADAILAVVGREDANMSNRDWWNTALGRACREARHATT
jgi:hypothetical protein